MEIKKPKIVKKPWGREIWIVDEPEYAGKILEIKRGFRTSLHYHKKKKESLYLLEGKLKVTHSKGEFMLKEGETLTLTPGDIHRFYAQTDVKFFEVSTSDLTDVVRVEDDYGRTKK